MEEASSSQDIEISQWPFFALIQFGSLVTFIIQNIFKCKSYY